MLLINLGEPGVFKQLKCCIYLLFTARVLGIQENCWQNIKMTCELKSFFPVMLPCVLISIFNKLIAYASFHNPWKQGP